MIIALVGPSGSGKSVLSFCLELFYGLKLNQNINPEKYDEIIRNAVMENLFIDVMPTNNNTTVFKEVVSHTTRPKRDEEVDGIHYFFVSVDDFMNLERYEETLYCDNYYGLTVKAVQDVLTTSEFAIVVVDQKGVANIKRKTDDICSIFIKTDIQTMKAHMEQRKDNPNVIEKRISNAQKNNEFYFADADYEIDNTGELSKTLYEALKIIESLRKKTS